MVRVGWLLLFVWLGQSVGDTMVRVLHTARDPPPSAVVYSAEDQSQKKVNIPKFSVASAYVPITDSPAYIGIVRRHHDTQLLVCQVHLPGRGFFSVVVWELRAQELRCSVFQDVPGQWLGRWSAHVRFMHFHVPSKRVHLQSRNHTLFHTVPPLYVTRYVRRRPGAQDFTVHSALRLGTTLAHCQPLLEAGQSYSLLYVDGRGGMATPVLHVLPDAGDGTGTAAFTWSMGLALAVWITATLMISSMAFWIVRSYQEDCRETRLLQPRLNGTSPGVTAQEPARPKSADGTPLFEDLGLALAVAVCP